MTCSTSYCLVTLKDLWNEYMYVCNIHPERIVVLIYGSNSSHIDVGLIEKARKEYLILKLSPHASHVL